VGGWIGSNWKQVRAELNWKQVRVELNWKQVRVELNWRQVRAELNWRQRFNWRGMVCFFCAMS
jgi:hypothetical protein